MSKCDAAPWCMAVPTPHTTVCRLHWKYPLKHSWEDQADWLRRIRKELLKEAQRMSKAKAGKR